MGIKQLLHRSRLYRWKVEFKRLNREHLDSLRQYYSYEYGNSAYDGKRVVCVMNGNFEAGGLADRLRGLVSVYQVCKELNLDFRISFTFPFALEDYLMPAEYDWLVEPEDICFDSKTDIVCCEVTDDTEYQSKLLHRWLRKRIAKSKANEIHIYGNPDFCYTDNTYAMLFRELFKPTESLLKAMEENIQAMGENYIAVQLRFTHLLGDIDDYGEVLQEEEQRALIASCIEKIRDIQSSMEEPSLILLNSDSKTFLEEAERQLDGIYIVNGGIAHIDFTPDSKADVHEKLFIDFLLMSKAKHIYRIVGPGMRKSGLPYSASLLAECPLTDICFS